MPLYFRALTFNTIFFYTESNRNKYYKNHIHVYITTTTYGYLIKANNFSRINGR